MREVIHQPPRQDWKKHIRPVKKANMIDRAMCFVFGHKENVWMNQSLGLGGKDPDRYGLFRPTPAWAQFGAGSIYLCPRCRVLFYPYPSPAELEENKLWYGKWERGERWETII